MTERQGKNWNTFKRLALPLLVVAVAQLALAGHKFEHDVTSVSEVCAVCLQCEQLDAPPVTTPSDRVVAGPATPGPAFPAGAPARTVVPAWSPRAPPTA